MHQHTDFTSLAVQESIQRFGTRIRAARKARKLSLQAMEDICRVHRTTIGRLERGDSGVSLATAFTILEALERLSDVELLVCQPESRTQAKPRAPNLDRDF